MSAKKSGLGVRALNNESSPAKYLEAVLGTPQEKKDEPFANVKSDQGEPLIWEQKTKKETDVKMVPKTWHLPENLAKRFDLFVLQKCPTGTRGVTVIRQVLDEFLRSQGF